MKESLSKIFILIIIALALGGVLSSQIALVMGFAFTFFLNVPFQQYRNKIIQYFLKASIVGLGFGIFVTEALEAGKMGITLTFLSIILTLSLGWVFARLLKIDMKLGHLITSGTAICGGSAIAAIAPIIRANAKTISMALGLVFLLNSIALFIFPTIGHWFHLSQNQFGLWCAAAIHDTSSVVGAALVYGDDALKIATTVKLSRTLWIIPLSFLSMAMFKTSNERIKIPYFILFFVLAIVLNSLGLISKPVSSVIVLASKRVMVLTLFLVGTSISIKDIRAVGPRPMLLALILWVSITIFSLVYILYEVGN